MNRAGCVGGCFCSSWPRCCDFGCDRLGLLIVDPDSPDPSLKLTTPPLINPHHSQTASVHHTNLFNFLSNLWERNEDTPILTQILTSNLEKKTPPCSSYIFEKTVQRSFWYQFGLKTPPRLDPVIGNQV